ncbi:type II toxin-antitoxin system RelE/ParE family toxin [Terrarubrum flagellatum]|uniref:type II toxin-antitoxin system RelE/ParE family toxin n=1 Tax=Terrirubrum flagellatum TaxID=2895980 RepID=UPI0031450BD2
MARRVEWSARARKDYLQLLDYIAQTDPNAADRVSDRIFAAAENLGVRPTGRPGRVAGTYERTVAKTSHIIAYQQTEETIFVVRVIHMSRDWPRGGWPKDEN